VGLHDRPAAHRRRRPHPMTSRTAAQTPDSPTHAALAELERFCRQVLTAAGADAPTAEAATRAMLHASRLGIDSHGVRLLDHYVTVMIAGRVNPRPQVRLARTFGAVATLEADDAH